MGLYDNLGTFDEYGRRIEDLQNPKDPVSRFMQGFTDGAGGGAWVPAEDETNTPAKIGNEIGQYVPYYVPILGQAAQARDIAAHLYNGNYVAAALSAIPGRLGNLLRFLERPCPRCGKPKLNEEGAEPKPKPGEEGAPGAGAGTTEAGGAPGSAETAGGAAENGLPPGSRIVARSDTPGQQWIQYQTADGQQRLRFSTNGAMTDNIVNGRPGAYATPDAEAGLNESGNPFVFEGRHRAVGAAAGDVIPPELGGVPNKPGVLDYPYAGDYTPPADRGVPVGSLRNPK